MLLSLRKNGLTSLFKEVRVFKECSLAPKPSVFDVYLNGSAPKERRRGRAEKRLSKRVFLESPFLLCPLKVFS